MDFIGFNIMIIEVTRDFANGDFCSAEDECE